LSPCGTFKYSVSTRESQSGNAHLYGAPDLGTMTDREAGREREKRGSKQQCRTGSCVSKQELERRRSEHKDDEDDESLDGCSLALHRMRRKKTCLIFQRAVN
jgi:hypothetical protein